MANEETVTNEDLQKSVNALMDLLQAEAPTHEDVDAASGDEEEMAKSMAQMGTLGGLADRTGDAPLDPTLAVGGEEMDAPYIFTEEEMEKALVEVLDNDPALAKSLADVLGLDDEELDAADEEVEGAQDAEFAKSLAAAFADREVVAELTAQNEFAKSLVLGTVEGLAIAHEEIEKSLVSMEARSDEKFSVLAKAVAAIGQAVAEIREEVKSIANGPARPMAKSMKAVGLEKSFGGNAPANAPDLIKSKVLGYLENEIKAGKMEPFALIRYETTGQIDPAVEQAAMKELGLL